MMAYYSFEGVEQPNFKLFCKLFQDVFISFSNY